jgi:hypothetical protein
LLASRPPRVRSARARTNRSGARLGTGFGDREMISSSGCSRVALEALVLTEADEVP